MAVDLGRVGKGVFDRISTAFPKTNQDRVLDLYRQMTQRDLSVLSNTYGPDITTEFIVDMEKRNLGGKNGY